MDLARVLKERRAVLKISQTDLAELAGVGLATIKDIERGAGNPSLTIVEKILDALGYELVLRFRGQVNVNV